jgi:undecaprenyl-diphosphatase
MTFLQAIILGLVQGLGEFLPISSSGHLVIFPWLFNFPDPGLSFDVALHLGTLIAIVLYFWKDFLDILKLAFQNYNRKSEIGNRKYGKNILWLLVVATIPGAFFGLLLEKQAETIFRNPPLIAGTLTIAGLVLYLADKYARHKRDLNDITKKDAIIIGLSQAFAIIPGVSRAGATITSGLFLGLTRVSSARFSFLLSAPIIFGATIIKVPHLIKSGLTSVEVTAIVVAALSGYLAIAWLLKFVEKVSYKVFFWYRILLAIVILSVWFVR